VRYATSYNKKVNDINSTVPISMSEYKDCPINSAIESKKDHISFHTPGHNGELSVKDITELSYSGNILSNMGVVEKSTRMASCIYGAENTVYITQGATTAIHIAIHALKNHRFLIVGDCHHSVFSAIRLYGVSAYFSPSLDNISKDMLAKRSTVLFFTSVDYFGNIVRIPQEILQNYIVVADESHGGHFNFSSKLPRSALNDVDILIHSLHKTMPVLTGGALLHFKKKHNMEIKHSINEIHSTSPSYLIASSMELAIEDFYINGNKYYSCVFDSIDKFSSELDKRFSILPSDDRSRLVIESEYSGRAVSNFLETQGVFIETSYQNRIVLIVTPFNYKKLELLSILLKNVNELEGYIINHKDIRSPKLRKLLNSHEYEMVNINDSIGRIAFREIGFYPPCIPILVAGDKITIALAEFIGANAKDLFGLEEDLICVVK
jgi:arginine/lysine/ornithine decarboxylase